MLQHDPKMIALKAKELLTEQGEKALSVAEANVHQSMDEHDVLQAGFWLAVLHEIKQLETASGLVN